jgi:dimethylamine/trimethylamine dehydrogenase
VLVTPAPLVSAWTINTLEQTRIQRRLLEIGVHVRANEALVGFQDGKATLACAFTGDRRAQEAQSVVMVTARLQNDALYAELVARSGEWSEAGIKTVERIGDAVAPGTIAAAVFGGHRFARELDRKPWGDQIPFLRENAELGPWTPEGPYRSG